MLYTMKKRKGISLYDLFLFFLSVIRQYNHISKHDCTNENISINLRSRSSLFHKPILQQMYQDRILQQLQPYRGSHNPEQG